MARTRISANSPCSLSPKWSNRSPIHLQPRRTSHSVEDGSSTLDFNDDDDDDAPLKYARCGISPCHVDSKGLQRTHNQQTRNWGHNIQRVRKIHKVSWLATPLGLQQSPYPTLSYNSEPKDTSPAEVLISIALLSFG